jgi:hypothetical protein
VETVIKKIRIELRDMKPEIKKVQMRIEEPSFDYVDFWQYNYYVRGYQGFKRHWEPALKCIQ